MAAAAPSWGTGGAGGAEQRPAALGKLSPELQQLLVARRGSADESKAARSLGVALVRPAAGRASASSAVSSDASAASAAPTVRVLVRTSAWLGVRGNRARLQAGGARLGRALPSVGAAVLEATPEQIAELSRDSSVLSISPDRPMAAAAALDVNAASVGVPEVQALAAPLLFRSGAAAALDGRGVGIAVLDSGVAPSPDLAGRIAAFKDFAEGAPDGQPYDDYGHGTHVAGIAAGDGAASSGAGAALTYRGIAPGASLISAKVLDGRGQGTISAAIAAIDWCIANRDAYNIRVINLSFGARVHESYRTDPLCQAAEKAVAAGIVVVAAAGNDRLYGGIEAPGNDPAVITVGASNVGGTAGRRDDRIATYTSRGPSLVDAAMKPDLVAPGSHVVSLRAPGSWIDVNHPETNVPVADYAASPAAGAASAYAQLSGTSMAAPAVAGAAALLLQANPRLTPSAVKASLMLSAQLLGGQDPLTGRTGVYDPLTQGAGELNLPGALEIALHLRPGAGFWGDPSMTSIIAGGRVRWSLSGLSRRWRRAGASAATLLNARAVWGSDVLWGSRAGWSDDLIWGGPIALAPADGGAAIAVQNVTWDTGGEDFTTAQNVTWDTGGEDFLGQTILFADNVTWDTGGEDVMQADNVTWDTGGEDCLPAEPIVGDAAE